MNEILTIVEHAEIIVSKTRDIEHNTISIEDRDLLFDIVYKDKKSKERYIFSHKGKDKIKASSIVGSVSLKNGLTVEILPKFAKEQLTEKSKKRYRKTLLNMVRVSNEKNFITSHAQSSKIPMEEMPLLNYVIELFSSNLLSSLRQGLYSEYSTVINNSSRVRGNILVAKTVQNNFIDKSKVYTSYNKHSTNNLLMQTFRTLAKILLEDENLSYRTKQNLHEIYLLLNGVNIINLKSEDFQRVVFNRLNDKFEVLHNQASFIFKKYMPFSSHINATPFWSILFDMDYLFEKFIAYLFRKSDIKFIEQRTTHCFKDKNRIVSARPDFIIENSADILNKKVISVIDAKWKLLSDSKSLYGLNSQNFWQMFSYMNLTNQDEEISGYFIVPKNSNNFDDEIIFDPIAGNNKSIKILSIDFSLEFSDLVNRYKFYIEEGELQIKQIRVKKDIEIENISKFNFKFFIDELEKLSKNKILIKQLIKDYRKNEHFKNIIFLKNIQEIKMHTFKVFIKENLKREQLVLDGLEIKYIPNNINKLKFLKILNLSNNKITFIPDELFLLKKIELLDIENNKLGYINANIKELKELKILQINGNISLRISDEILKLKNLNKIVADKNNIDMNISVFKNLIKNNVKILDENNINLNKYIEVFKIEKSIKCIKCNEYKKKESFSQRLHKKTNYKTGVCKECENLNTRERSKGLKPILNERYNSLKQKAKENNKKLKYTQKEFVDYFSNDKILKDLYSIWIENKENRNEDLKPNFYFRDEKLDYNLSNIAIATTKNIREINKKTGNNKLATPVRQFTKDGEFIQKYNSMQIAKDKTGINTGLITKSCNEEKIVGDYIWIKEELFTQERLDRMVQNHESIQSVLKSERDNKTQKDVISESDNKLIRELLIELRDDKIAKKFSIDDKCILSDDRIEEFIQSRPLNLEEFNLRFPLKLRGDSIKPYEQMQFKDEIFEILGSIDE